MAFELGSAVLGAAVGLLGGLSAVALTHLLTSRRDTRARRLDGLREVVTQLEKRRRLALDIDQHINLGLRRQPPHDLAKLVFDIPGWKEATLSLQERPWLFCCLAYLPEAVSDFQELDAHIAVIMDPALDEPGAEARRKLAIERFNEYSRSIRSKVESKLRKLT